MKRRPFARSGAVGGPAKAQDALTKAYLRIFSGEDGEMVLADLASVTGYYRRPSYAEWMARTKTPNGFELHSALSNARAEVLQHIMGFLTMDDDALIALEKAARLEGR
ncbi:hypothetical protein [Mesorhizobium sp. B2-1-3A]|uniref:Bbp19 family protein n=1 Tax=Mesorhizobium sp. B2-1-3A TaxID=2589971 RepID=UPI0011294323|nr:hypothetical protein [Mesorhizobium sp. B2-1-3A]TPM89857.1 hypothetical protein FJ977_35355 [Mesorhizobium sp. B2-1-3A]